MSLCNIQILLEDAGLPSEHNDITLLNYKHSMGADVEKIPAELSNKLFDIFNRKLFSYPNNWVIFL